MKIDINRIDRDGMTKLQWSDLDQSAKNWIIGMGIYEVLEKLVAWHFIYHTPKEKTRGSKWMWFALSFVNFVGPLSYAIFGRKRG
ncbi:PLDc N-terminal domain-containing protein [Corynebacterium sp. H130]|uniref:PLDc N-terminal domain-containing protein n=1 Tax=Corynebacterium sp. H130 TaxID=3133444 RepID=UPI0030B3BF59